MRQILETEEHVQIPPGVYSDPFYRITYMIKEEIRKFKWTEGEKAASFFGRRLAKNGPPPTERSMRNFWSRPCLFLTQVLRRSRLRRERVFPRLPIKWRNCRRGRAARRESNDCVPHCGTE